VSTALQRAEERYAATPRKLDALLERKARGDRGCLFDVASGVGILASFGCLIASQAGLIAFTWTYLGIGLWVVSYFLGAKAQAASGELRRAAMESGALVAACVVTSEPHLRSKGNRRSGRALVVFALRAPDASLEPSATQRKLAGLLGQELPGDLGPGGEGLRKALGDEFCFDFVALEAPLRKALGLGSKDDESGKLYLTRVVVDPEQLDGGTCSAGDELALIVAMDSHIAEAV
jgi:hypothetical protein